ncbi:hypothetical protein TrLO_g7270 [Triparma laevis f. longispina]|uniref:Protein kinase domain-containing protein n=1 Tax=Triparma laevis f. longispina TaxID=1714387 RepID=A0A9W6ZT60_9STRA|nr:hypothetical protein TrLO_g7270 [Triparma laevis f. longispina]
MEFPSAFAADLSSLTSSLKTAFDSVSQSRSPSEIVSALGELRNTQLFETFSHSPVAQTVVGFYLSFALISWILTPPALPVPYPSGTYDARTASQYFSTRGFTQLARCVEIGGLSVGFILRALVLDKIFKPATEEAETMLGEQRGEELAELLTDLGPTFIKVGQSLSIRSDLLSESYVKGLTKLQDKVPPFPSSEAFKMLEDQLGQSVDALFSTITPEPIASASLGQVYKATVRSTGEEVAIKIQRPRSVEKIALDMHLVRTISAPLKAVFNINTDLVGTVDNWGLGFVDELDYVKEADNARLFSESILRTTLKDVVFAPKPLEKFSTSSILTTEWIDGERLDQSSQADISTLCGVAMNAYLSMMLELGVLHCDPHPGNLLRTPDGRLCILDWGLVTSLDSDLQTTLVEHVAHLTSGDYEEVPNDLVLLGFVPEQMKEKMQEAKIVETLADIYGQWSLGGGANRIDVNSVVDDIRGLTKAGEGSIFQVPPYFFYIGKAFSVLEGIGLTNDPEYSVINACLPYISTRLIADKSDRMAGALDSFIFGPSKNDSDRTIDVERVELLASGVGKFTASSSGELTKDKRALLEDQADALLDVVLSVETPVNDLIIEQMAKILGATTRKGWMQLRERSGLVRNGKRSVLGLLVDPIGLWQSSAIANIDNADENVLAASTRLIELAQEIGGPLLADLGEDEVRELAGVFVQKLANKREKIPAVGTKLLASIVKQTADRLEQRVEGIQKVGKRGAGKEGRGNEDVELKEKENPVDKKHEGESDRLKKARQSLELNQLSLNEPIDV